MAHKLLKGLILIALAGFASCTNTRNLLQDTAVVARVGRHKLFRADVRKFIPPDVSFSDSTNLALQYINSWAAEQIFNDMALAELPKEDLDVTAELEAYKRSLLRYRYEQHYINDRLDTVVSIAQMREYYLDHQSLFKLERPILKVRFIDIYSEVPDKSGILEKMASNRPSDVLEVDSLARANAIRYFDHSEEWMDAAELAHEFGVDYGTMLSNLKNSYITVTSDEFSDIKVAYVREIKRDGIAPFEFSQPQIKEYILSSRKRALVENLERNLLTEALDREQFVIY